MNSEIHNEGDVYGQSFGNQGQITYNFNMAHVPGQPHLPLQRPPRATHFTDRKDELVQLLADLQPGQIATLCGPGGIGKSALAAEAIWQLAPEQAPPSQFPDGILFHTFYNQPQADLALEHFVRSFGGEARPTPRAAALNILGGKQALLVLDGTEDADDLEAILNIRGRCGVLVTSRRHEDANDAWQDIHPLPTDEAVELLQKWAGSLADDEAAARAVCDLVGRLPLAIRLVGRYLAHRSQPVGDYLEWLAAIPLQALDHGQKREQSVPYLIEKSLDQLPDEATEILAVVGQLALAPFTIDVIDATLDYAQPLLRQHLGELVNYGLLLAEAGLYQVTHALIHTYASKRLPVAEAAFARLVDYCDAYAREQSQQGLEGFQRLHIVRPHLLQLQQTCLERGEWLAVFRFVWILDTYFNLQGFGGERIQLLKTGIAAAQRLGLPYEEGSFYDKLGTAYLYLGQMEEAIWYLERAISIAQELGDKQAEGVTLGALGAAYADLGQEKKAINYFERALNLAQEMGNKEDEGDALANLAVLYIRIRQFEIAVAYIKQAIKITQESGDRRREGNCLGNFGIAYRYMGQVGTSINYFEQALTIFQEKGDKRGEGYMLGNLGAAYSSLGQVNKAISYIEQALKIAQKVGDKQNESLQSWNLGILIEETDPAKAAALMSIQVAYKQEIGHPDAITLAERLTRTRAKLNELD